MSIITNKFPLFAAILTIISGGLVIMGWAFDIPILMRILPFWMPMKANAAFCLVLLGWAIILSNYLPAKLNANEVAICLSLGRLFAILVGLFNLLTLAEYAFKLDLGIDAWLFPTPVADNPAELNPLRVKLDAAFPSRIKLEAAVCLLFLALATLIRSDKNLWRIVSASFGLSVVAISLASLTSYFSPALGQFGWFGYGIMRMNAAVLLVLLGAAIVSISWQRNILSWSLNKSMTSAFTCGLFLLVITGFNSSRIQYWLNDTNYEISLNEKIISHVESILADITNCQTNTRGFVITGHERFLKGFIAAKNDSLINLAKLRQADPVESTHPNHITKLENSINQQLQWYQHVIETRQNGKIITTEMIFHGTDLFEAMRAIILKIKDDHYQNFTRLKQKASNVSSISYLIICVGTLTSVGIFLAALFRLNYTQSQREQAESALKVSEERFRILFNQAPVGIALIDSLTGQIYNANPKYAEIVGLTVDELQTIEWIKITHPDDVQADLYNMALMNAGKTNGFMMEKRYIHANGSIVWVNLTVAKIPIQEQGHPCHHCIVEDITERKQAEAVLLAKQKEVNYLRDLMDTVPGYAFIKDLNLNYVHANHSFCDLLKIPCDQIKGKTDYDIFPHDLAEKYIADDKKVMANRQLMLFEEETIDVSNNHQRFVVATRKLPWLDEKGEVCGVYGLGFDISELKQTEKELRESKIFFELLARVSPIGIYQTNASGDCVFVNDKWCEIANMTREQAQGKGWAKALMEDDKEKVYQEWQASVNEHRTFSLEYRFQQPNGNVIWVYGLSTPIYDEQGIITGYVGTITDITQRKQIEESLARISRQNELILNSAGEGIYGLDLLGHTTFANLAATRLLGYSFTEMIGHSQHDLIHHSKPDGSPYPRENCPIYSAFKDGKVHHVDTEVFWHKDGTAIPVDYISCPIRNESGEITGAVIVFSDITERKLLEKQLSESKDFFETLTTIAPIGIYQTDAKGNCLFINAKGCEIIGLSKEQALGPGWGDRILSMDSDRLYQKWAAADQEQRTAKLEYRIQRTDGTIIWVYGLSTPMYNEQRQVSGYIGTIIDITDRKQAEAELSAYHNHLEELVEDRTAALTVAKESAEAANRAKSAFIANMSHELRTPLHAIMGFSELMAQDDSLNAKQKENLATIHRSGWHLLTVINDILEISKIDTGRFELKIQAFDLHKLLHEMSDKFKIRAENKRLNFRLEIPPDVPQYVKTDADKLQLVLLNLLENALKFTLQGQIILRSHALLQPAFAQVMLEIEVIDTGSGIPTDKLDDLFKPFVQLARRDLGLEGTGLGLAMCKSLIELMGGQIHVHSLYGKGSTFKIELPVSTANVTDVAAQTDVKNTDFSYPEPFASAASVELEITPDILSKLPLELRQQLHQAALNLDPEAAELIISQIRQIDSSIANSFQELVNQFQFEQIIELVNPTNQR